MIINVPSKFIKVEDIEPGMTLTIKDEGKEVDGKWGKKFQFEVELSNGVAKPLTLNGTSLKYMIKTYGKDSKAWVGKVVPVSIEKMMVKGERLKVIVLGEEVDDDDSTAVDLDEENV
jgi:hypothetical protein